MAGGGQLVVDTSPLHPQLGDAGREGLHLAEESIGRHQRAVDARVGSEIETDEFELVGQRVDQFLGGDLPIGHLEVAQRLLEVLLIIVAAQQIERLQVDILQAIEHGPVLGVGLDLGRHGGPVRLGRGDLGMSPLQASFGQGVDGEQPGAHDVGAPRGEAHPVEDDLLGSHGVVEALLPTPLADARHLGLGLEHCGVGSLELGDVVGRQVRLQHGPLGLGQLGSGVLESVECASGAATLALHALLELIDMTLESGELVGQLGGSLGGHELDRCGVADGFEQHLGRSGVERGQLADAPVEARLTLFVLRYLLDELVAIDGLGRCGAGGRSAIQRRNQRRFGAAGLGRHIGVLAAGTLDRFAQDAEGFATRTLPGTGGVEVGETPLGGGDQELLGGEPRDAAATLRASGQVAGPHHRVEVGPQAEQLEGLNRQVEQHAMRFHQAARARVPGVGKRGNGGDDPSAGRGVQTGNHRHHRVEIERVVVESELNEPHPASTIGRERGELSTEIRRDPTACSGDTNVLHPRRLVVVAIGGGARRSIAGGRHLAGRLPGGMSNGPEGVHHRGHRVLVAHHLLDHVEERAGGGDELGGRSLEVVDAFPRPMIGAGGLVMVSLVVHPMTFLFRVADRTIPAAFPCAGWRR